MTMLLQCPLHIENMCVYSMIVWIRISLSLSNIEMFWFITLFSDLVNIFLLDNYM